LPWLVQSVQLNELLKDIAAKVLSLSIFASAGFSKLSLVKTFNQARIKTSSK
jgi:hypothetical protein